MNSPSGSKSAHVTRWQNGSLTAVEDCVADEVPVALVYNGISHVVMMATPGDLADFALGFSLTEVVVNHADEIYGIDPSSTAKGYEIAIQISGERFTELKARRRNLTGRTGCGLCGAESLEQALRPIAPVQQSRHFEHAAIQTALVSLTEWQSQQASGALHAAAWVSESGGIGLLREDIGRHNALDKVIGALASQKSLRSGGFLIVSSRASYEMVAKAASAGFEMLVALSAPTSLAIQLAHESGITLVGFAREGRHAVYAHSQRL